MKLINILLFSLILFSPFSFSQKLPDDVVVLPRPNHKKLKAEYDNYFLNAIQRMKITYVPSEKFVNTDTDYDRFCLTRKLFIHFAVMYWGFGCSYPFLTSKDDEIIIFSDFYFDDSIEKQEEQIKLRLKSNLEYLGKDAKNWGEFFFFYPKKKKRFNNNLIFKYTIPLFSEDFINRNGKEYKYTEKFFIWDKKVGFIDLTCFYTDKAKKNFKKYWRDVEKMFEYGKK